jgi:hypothetical protein
MDEQGLQNLLALGFSYEDLYKKGLLVLKNSSGQNDENAAAAAAGSTAAEEQNAQNQASAADPTQSADADQSAGEAQSAADPTQSAEYIKMWKAFDLFKAEIKQMIQGQNRENAFRDNPNDQAMTVSAAIEGLYKGGK